MMTSARELNELSQKTEKTVSDDLQRQGFMSAYDQFREEVFKTNVPKVDPATNPNDAKTYVEKAAQALDKKGMLEGLSIAALSKDFDQIDNGDHLLTKKELEDAKAKSTDPLKQIMLDKVLSNFDKVKGSNYDDDGSGKDVDGITRADIANAYGNAGKDLAHAQLSANAYDAKTKLDACVDDNADLGKTVATLKGEKAELGKSLTAAKDQTIALAKLREKEAALRLDDFSKQSWAEINKAAFSQAKNGQGWWHVARESLGVAPGTKGMNQKIADEAARLEKLNGGMKLHPGSQVRIMSDEQMAGALKQRVDAFKQEEVRRAERAKRS